MAASTIDRLLDIMAQLRNPDGGCPWDLEQTFSTIAPYTIEEAYEVAEAIERGAPEQIKDELGDLLFQVVFHARMAEEAELFDFDAVVAAICNKMIRRHPHVFGDAEVGSAEDQTANWEALKAEERRQQAGDGPLSALDGIGDGLPALMRAAKLQGRAAKVGFDWPEPRSVLAKLREEASELEAELDAGGSQERLDEELGDLLFSAVNLARHLKVDPDGALRRASLKFDRRFRHMESQAAAEGAELSLHDSDALERRWEAAKSQS